MFGHTHTHTHTHTKKKKQQHNNLYWRYQYLSLFTYSQDDVYLDQQFLPRQPLREDVCPVAVRGSQKQKTSVLLQYEAVKSRRRLSCCSTGQSKAEDVCPAAVRGSQKQKTSVLLQYGAVKSRRPADRTPPVRSSCTQSIPIRVQVQNC